MSSERFTTGGGGLPLGGEHWRGGRAGELQLPGEDGQLEERKGLDYNLMAGCPRSARGEEEDV